VQAFIHFNFIDSMFGIRKRFVSFEPLPDSEHGAAAKVGGT